ncbi:hypothetical protein [Halobacillus sp. A5]|uniref:hypothetical protein n=1 Tax=Halobacillus sp. A5 TaxID=2880263 RepID=UPI0020A62EFC|nr:hypothetical protein [Halobacillus sp. A5]MCP3027622.1 hypothetical protein [Halobacillus sp. A5]
MNRVFLVSILAVIFLTYKLIQVIKNKEAPKGNKKIAWSLYGFFAAVLVIVNIYFPG